MAAAESQIRKAHKQGSGTDRLVNAARLSVLEKNIGVAIKRHRNPDQLSLQSDQDITKDETVFLGKES
jgi:hypothetical protein